MDAHGDLLAGIRDLPARASGLVRWDGQHWQPLGPKDPAGTARSLIRQLLVQPDGSLVATGYLEAAGQRIIGAARWTGTAWQRLGPDVREPDTQAHLALEATGKLVNLMDYSASDNHTRPTYWNGTAWQPLATGLTGQVEHISLTPLTQELRATGRFVLPGDTVTRRVARWDGTRWQPASPLPGALASLPNGTALAQLPSGEVLADFWQGLAWWNGSAWYHLTGDPQAGVDGPRLTTVRALAATAKGEIVLAGRFWQDSSKERYNVARWNGHRQPVGTGFSNYVNALAITPAGDFIAGGHFLRTGIHDSARLVARWDGRHWRQLGAGLPGHVNVLAVAPNGNLVAGGSFGVARWNGRSWELLKKTAPGTHAPDDVYALTFAPNGDIFSSNSTYRDSEYNITDSVVSRWNGTRWQRVGEELPFDVASLIQTSEGDLIAGGGRRHSYEGHSSTTGYVMRWNGTSWQAIGPELHGRVNAMAVAANGDLLIGGTFDNAGAVDGKGGNPAADNVARWHDGAWQPLGAGLNEGVDALVVAPNGDIVVGGTFTATNDGLAMWHFGIYRDQ